MLTHFTQLQIDNLLTRQRIIELFKENEDKPLIKVIADAGYGKTRAVLSYVSKSDSHIIWVSLSTLDNYTSYFWKNFCNALSTLDHQLITKIEKIGFPEDLTSLHQFIKMFAEEVYRDKPFILIFDDYHLITDSTVINFIDNIISVNIENLTIFLLSRIDKFPYKTYGLLPNSVCTITNDQLAFTRDELYEYFTQLNISLSLNTLNFIYKKTEGWPIAVYLLALFAKENAQFSDFSDELTNYLMFNIIEQVIFSKYSVTKQKVLIKLSLFNSFSIQFIKQITNNMPDEDIMLLFSNLLIRYNPHTQSYHFHQLLREFLQQKLSLLNDQEIQETYKIAGKWFKKFNLNIDALDCYSKLKDYKTLWEIILKIILKRGSADEGKMILNIINGFPQSFIEQNPTIQTVYGISIIWSGQFREAILEFENIIKKLKINKDHQNNEVALGETYLLLGLLYMLYGDTSFVSCFKKAYYHLPNDSQLLNYRWMVLNTDTAITLKDGSEGEMENWIESLEESSTYLELLLNKNTYGLEFLAKSEAAYYQGNLNDAEKYAFQAIYRGKEEILVDIVCNSYFVLSKIAIAKGQYQKNLEYLSSCKTFAMKYNTESQYNIPEVAVGLYYTKLKKINLVPDWIINDRPYNNVDILTSFGLDNIVKAYCLLIESNYNELIPYLNKTEISYQESNHFIYLIYVYILKAIVYHLTGDDEQLYANFLLAYNLSHKNNLVMLFAEYGSYMRNLIRYVQSSNEDHGIPKDWLAMVYSKATTYAKRLNYMRRQHERTHPISKEISLLSKREKEILTDMSQGLTREEIADNMNISLNNVKGQIKSIYSKLGAINGMHAVNIAITKGFINNQ